jgi:hypothetical protein
MGWLAVVIALFPFASSTWAADDDIVGTYRLISANRVILATGDTEDSYGKNPIGFMTYGREGRMMGMIVFRVSYRGSVNPTALAGMGSHMPGVD